MILRPYQQECLDAVYTALKAGGSRVLAHMDTGAGKTPTLCSLIRRTLEVDADAHILVLCDRKELIAQIAATWDSMSTVKASVYAASLRRREVGQIMIAQVQSVATRANLIGHRKLVIVDECHAIPDDGEGRYRSLLADLGTINPRMRLVGFTATPYRLGLGKIYGKERMFESLVYSTDMKQLIADGYLCPLIGKTGAIHESFNLPTTTKGEFANEPLQDFMSDAGRVSAACREIKTYSAGRRHVLVFACGIEHARLVESELKRLGIAASTITGDDDGDARDAAISSFKAGGVKCLINVQVLTTGFDFPAIDMIALLRPTMSAGLFSQMAGRGLRVAQGKRDCLILDMGGNLERHGPLDEIAKNIREKGERKEGGVAPARACPSCYTVVPTTEWRCPQCGHEWQRVLARHDTQASGLDVLSNAPETRKIDRVFWTVKAPRINAFGAAVVCNVWMGVESSQVYFNLDGAGRVREHAKIKLAAWGCPEDVLQMKDVAIAAWMTKNAAPPTSALVRRAPGKLIIISVFR